jgi:signal transduction histidine kinase/CheY-like chemotaxis protein
LYVLSELRDRERSGSQILRKLRNAARDWRCRAGCSALHAGRYAERRAAHAERLPAIPGYRLSRCDRHFRFFRLILHSGVLWPSAVSTAKVLVTTTNTHGSLSGILGSRRVARDSGARFDGKRKSHVLIVEDERIVARDLQIRLTGMGYEVTEISSSKAEALSSVVRNRPEVVLMDIRLNGVAEGIEAARQLKADFNLPVIYLTGHSDGKTLAEAATTEPFGYILKPFENRELMAAIETAVFKHRAETRLREANNRLHLAQHAGRVGVFDWNGETGEFHVTPELEDLHQAAPGTLRDFDDLWGRGADEAEQRTIQQRFEKWVNSERAESSWEHRIPLDSGAAIWVQVRAMAYRDAQGRLRRIIGTEVDITSRKKMEDALLLKDRELENSNAELQAYAYTIAHDLQEPVRTLICGVELIERGLAEKMRGADERLLFYVKNSAERLRSMIAGLLEYSRVGQEDEPEAIANCNEVMLAVTQLLNALIVETGARIEAGPLPAVAISGQRAAQLFQNLVGNALKFRRKEVEPRVTVSAERAGACWRFIVADNGVGFDMAYRERIFGVFKRLQPREVEGTGIGLSVCRRIVERAGGTIHAESVPGEGSKFMFTLPAVKSQL